MALVSRGANIALETDLGYGITGNLVDLAAWRELQHIAMLILQLADQQGVGRRLAQEARHAVFWAVRHDYSELLAELIVRGADPSQTDGVCGSALTFAAEHSRSDAASALLLAGAWRQEPAKGRVIHLLHDRHLLHKVDRTGGRGTGVPCAEDAAGGEGHCAPEARALSATRQDLLQNLAAG